MLCTTLKIRDCDDFEIKLNLHQGQSSQSTVDSEEVFKFSELCYEFWNINGPFQALHTMNRVRVQLIRDALLGDVKRKHLVSKPLNEKNILDIGCGGGILSEVR